MREVGEDGYPEHGESHGGRVVHPFVAISPLPTATEWEQP